MGQRLDGKCHGTLYKNKDGSQIPSDQFVVFLAKDNCFPPTLKFYLEECIRQRADIKQVSAVRALIERVYRWRDEHPELLKLPDVAPGEIQTEDP